MTEAEKILERVEFLTIFRSIRKDEMFKAIIELCREKTVESYSKLAEIVYFKGGNLTEHLMETVMYSINPLTELAVRGKSIPDYMIKCLQRELETIQLISEFSSENAAKICGVSPELLPEWKIEKYNVADKYMNMLEEIPVAGHGNFARYKTFRLTKGGRLEPVKSYDGKTVEELYGYQREREQVMKNTEALVKGERAADILLYGDAGTGKSSTVKAVCNNFFDRGLRLIEINRNAIEYIPELIDEICDLSLKFILYLDDLSFEKKDETFSILKGILEGNVNGPAGNIAVYATSNRQHLVAEGKDERTGNEIHMNDALQETMSLSDRFGLMLVFSKPEKDLYLEIVHQLADKCEIDIDRNNIDRMAEAFAIRHRGRSPRTAQQFIQLVKTGLINN